MKWPRLAATLLTLAYPSYAASAGAEGFMGASIDAKATRPVASRSAGPHATAPGAPVGRYAKALAGLAPEGRNVTRGAKETQVYQTASPAVVLVVSKDALGSGALISKDGLIVTNLHVVGDAAEVGVVFKPPAEGAAVSKADIRSAKVVRRDEVADLALIRVAEVPAHVTPLTVAASTTVQIGADVHAIGHPTGEAWTYTRGIVSQIRRDYQWSAEDHIPHKATVIQTQTPINPGNSGGPLLDDGFQLIGVNSFSGEGEGLNFAVSAEDVKALLDRREDRLLEPETHAKAKAEMEAAKAACEPQVVGESRTKGKTPGDTLAVDEDCDGKGDYVLIVPDNKKEPEMMLFDENGDGEIDVIVFDEKRDGKPDYVMIDTDHNGQPDMMGYYRKGEDEPYKYERMDEK